MTEQKKLPVHVAIVMDGNGRWAQEKNLPRLTGHNSGMLALKEIVKASSQLGIKHLTVYAFSTENWKRPEDEVTGIFKLLIVYIEKELSELNQRNVKVDVLGDFMMLPRDAVRSLEKSLKATEGNTGLQFHIALNYGSRNEILRSVRAISAQVHRGDVNAEDITEADISDHLYTSGIPDPDLIIRTGGELRLSNFLLWQSAYSELWFTDVYWPDFTRAHLEQAIAEFQQRKRRFGDIK